MSKIKNILVVEDDVDFCNSIVNALQHDGYRPTGVTTAREAIFKLTNQQYDCLVLDMRLENETGEEVIKAIRKQKDSQNTNTPTVVISGYLDKKLMSGVAKYIQGALVKPFELSKLLEIVKKNLA